MCVCARTTADEVRGGAEEQPRGAALMELSLYGNRVSKAVAKQITDGVNTLRHLQAGGERKSKLFIRLDHQQRGR